MTFSSWAAEEANPIGHFEIVRFEVEGNTLLPSSVMVKLLAPFAGKNRDFGYVQRALETLEAAYHQRGFKVVQVMLPEQELNQGIVRLKVIETRLGKVTVEGNKFFSQANIRQSLPALRPGKTPNIGDVSASLKIANENPAKKTSLQLQSGEQDDEINAILKVTDEKPWKAGLNLDNTGDSKTGKTHVGFLYQNADIGSADQVLSLQYTTTLENPNLVHVYGAGYHIPLYALGDSVDVFGSYSDVDSGSVSAGIFNLLVSGKGSVLGVRYNHYLSRVDNYESKLVYGMDYKAYQNNVTLQGTQLGNDVTVHPISINYSGTWTLPAGEAGFSLTALHNLPGGNKGDNAAFNAVRSGALPHYSILRYNANYTHALPKDWQLRVALNGQMTRDSLVPSEQFGAGGASSVRGFPEREIANDTGYFTNTELYTPNLCSGIKATATQCRLLAFYDNAQVSRNNSLPGEQSQASIGSIGLGLRLAVSRYLTLQMDMGQVVDAGFSEAKGERRLHFLMGLTY